MNNKIILEGWDDDGTTGRITLDYDPREDDEAVLGVIGMTIEFEIPTQRLAFFKRDLLLAIKQLELL